MFYVTEFPWEQNQSTVSHPLQYFLNLLFSGVNLLCGLKHRDVFELKVEPALLMYQWRLLIMGNINIRVSTGCVLPSAWDFLQLHITAKSFFLFCNTLHICIFVSFDKNYHPVFIDYSLMTHRDKTEKVIHLFTAHWALCCMGCVRLF